VQTYFARAGLRTLAPKISKKSFALLDDFAIRARTYRQWQGCS